jgi:hypothetical protein
VVVKNTGDTTITEDFSVYLYIGQSEYLDQKSISVDLSPGETYTVHFDMKFIYESIGSFTMDAYINDDYDTRTYCNFIVTLTGRHLFKVLQLGKIPTGILLNFMQHQRSKWGEK